MAADQVVFAQALEGLFVHGIPERVTPRLKERLRELGVDLDRQLDPAYPREVWSKTLAVTREEILPDPPENDGYFELGRAVVNGYAQTFIGRALGAMVRILGPKRMLARMTHNLRSAGNFNETRLTEQRDGSFEVWINEAIINPYYAAGLFEAALRFAGAQDVEIALKGVDVQGATYAVRWR